MSSSRTPQEELELLRVSVARIAQTLGVEFETIPVSGKSFEELAEMAKKDRGWNATCAVIIEEIENSCGQ
jgi:hypothetical protein